MVDLLEEASNLVRIHTDKQTYERAKAYWIGSIDVGLGEGAFVDMHQHTFAKTLTELGIPTDLDEDIEDEEECEEDDETEIP